MDPNPNEFPLLCYLLNQLDPQTHAPLPTQLHQSLMTQLPHLDHPKVLPSLTKLFSDLNTTHTLSLLPALGARPDPSALSAARAKIAETHSTITEDELHGYQVVVRLEEMHEECMRRLKGAEEVQERLVEAYRLCVAQLLKGVDDEEVNEEVVGILRKAVTENELVERVDLSGRQLRILPDAFGMIRGLVVLNLSSNHLEAIPDSIAGLKQLEELDISSNLLKSLPDSIGLLHNLKILNLSGNSLNALPESVALCRSLVELDASFNNLTFLPTALGYGLVNLQRFLIPFNKIQVLPSSIGEMRSLTYLDVHFNELHGLPQTIGRLTNLEYLNISSNFNDMAALPETFGDLVNLKELDLSNNQIRILPYTFVRLKNLTKLNLDQNPIIVPPLEVVNQGAKAVRELMAKQLLELIDEQHQQQRNMAETENQQAQTGWLAWFASLLNNVGAGNAPRDPWLDQEL